MALQRKLYMLNGLQFFFIPKTHSKVYFHRKNLARNGGAVINREYLPDKTTHILVDTKYVYTEDYLVNQLKTEAFTSKDIKNVKIVKQDWLVDSIFESKLKETDQYEIHLNPNFFQDKLDPHFLVPKNKLIFKDDEGKTIVTSVPKLQIDRASKLKVGQKNDTKDDTTSVPVVKKKFKKVNLLEEQLRSECDFEQPNLETIKVLSRIADQMTLQGLDFKAKRYRMAIETLKKQKVIVSTTKFAESLPGIGPSIAQKIEQIAQHQRLPQLDEFEQSKESKLLKLFTNIHGVGPRFAQKWIKEGMESLDDIRARQDLTTPQKLGLEYYDDWLERISREECEAHFKYISKKMQKIDPLVELTIGGSYRRGAQDCGDIDFIVTRPDADMNEMKTILSKLRELLMKSDYLKCELNKPSSKLMAGCALGPVGNKKLTGKFTTGKCRRIDFLLVPWSEIGAALIYFTGNDNFNRALRFRASKMNLILNESGLFKRITYKQGQKVKDREMLIESFSERKIFKLLGVEYEAPEQRNMGSNEKLVDVKPDEIDENEVIKKNDEETDST
ncbi:unnamed protein product [Wickerhamomyces anomalus]